MSSLQSDARAATIPVTSTDDVGPGTLRQALATAGNGDTIDATGVSGTIILTNGQLLVSNSVAIVGPGPNLLTISGNNAHRIFFINPGAPGATNPPTAPFPAVSISGVTLANGVAQGGLGAGGGGGGGGAAGMGGAIFINGGDVTLSTVSLLQNTALGGDGGGGGCCTGGGGGGGGGVGGNGTSSSSLGGGGDDLGGNGGVPNENGGEGGGGGGGFFFGGSRNGGMGGFGGGGGGGSCCDAGGNGGNGGFGGGGGGASPLNSGTPVGGLGGTFGGGGGNLNGGNDGGGGGGGGLGGAIFVRFGSLSICGGILSSNVAFHGNGGPGKSGIGFAGTNGLGKGGAIFIASGAVAQADAATTFSANAAQDAAGSGTDTADVFGVLAPTTALTITCPTNIVTDPNLGCSATVTFTTTATGGCGPSTIVSTPPSGSTFPIGTNTVVSTATDAAGNTASCSFTVTVTGNSGGDKCPLGSGFWKNHPELWPVTSLTLGTVTYDQAQLLTILNASTKGDASLILANQLIAALLNQANGAQSGPLCSILGDANSLLDGCTLPCKVKPSSVQGKTMVNAASMLEAYNESLLTPGCSP